MVHLRFTRANHRGRGIFVIISKPPSRRWYWSDLVLGADGPSENIAREGVLIDAEHSGLVLDGGSHGALDFTP
jgi:hypothetical protein